MLIEIAKLNLSEAIALSALTTSIAAFFVAFKQYKATKYESRRSAANSIYKDYLLLAFQNPHLSSASYPLENPAYNKIKCEPSSFEQYEYYVSILLFASEEILEITKGDREWKMTLSDQLRYHALYLNSLDLQEAHYSKSIVALREEAIAAYSHDSGQG